MSILNLISSLSSPPPTTTSSIALSCLGPAAWQSSHRRPGYPLAPCLKAFRPSSSSTLRTPRRISQPSLPQSSISCLATNLPGHIPEPPPDQCWHQRLPSPPLFHYLFNEREDSPNGIKLPLSSATSNSGTNLSSSLLNVVVLTCISAQNSPAGCPSMLHVFSSLCAAVVKA